MCKFAAENVNEIVLWQQKYRMISMGWKKGKCLFLLHIQLNTC